LPRLAASTALAQNPPMRILLPIMLAVCATAQAQTVAVDVGHYNEEPGAMSSRGRPELEFNRELAKEIGSTVRKHGLRTEVIGADGLMARLVSRTAAAANADFFLSVHHDSVQPYLLDVWEYEGEPRLYSDKYSGFSLFVSRKNPWVGASLACASAIGAALQRAGFKPSLYHADPIPGEGKPFADRANGVHYYDNLIVLKTARSPAVLLEAGVIVNRDEELKMRSGETHRAIAAAVAQGLERCLPRKKLAGVSAR
jgi:N-acetylmuramoyl-L-alanine amidase